MKAGEGEVARFSRAKNLIPRADRVEASSHRISLPRPQRWRLRRHTRRVVWPPVTRSMAQSSPPAPYTRLATRRRLPRSFTQLLLGVLAVPTRIHATLRRLATMWWFARPQDYRCIS